MLEYTFEKVPCNRGVFVGKIPKEQHREMILRRASIDSVGGNLKGQLDNTVIVDEKGRRRKLKAKKEEA